jgi:hypothetical protein
LKVPGAAAPDQELTVPTLLIAARFTTVHEFRKRFWQHLKFRVQRGFLVGTGRPKICAPMLACRWLNTKSPEAPAIQPGLFLRFLARRM